jgi:hypothetical protein
MSNPLSPDLMTTAERLDEIASILAAGILRLRRRQRENDSSHLEKNRLDLPSGRSVDATTRTRRRVAR